MVEINGQKRTPMSGWVIARIHGEMLLGIPKRASLLGGGDGAVVGLKPVYQFLVVAMRAPDGSINGSRYDAIPLMFLYDVDEVDFDDKPGFVVSVDRQSLAQQRRLYAIVQQAEAMRAAQRGNDSGIVQAGAIPPGLKPPGAA